VTHLVVGEESSFLGVVASLAAATGRRVDAEVVLVGEGESAAVGGHADHQLVLGSTQLDPHVGGVLHTQLLAPLGVGRGCVQGRVVARLALPLAVEVVRHQVDEVQITAINNKDINYIV